MNLFCAPQEETEVEVDDAVLECDYDRNPTNLYQAIESQAWVPVLEFLDTGKWDHMYHKDRQTPSVQARTWVTRFRNDGNVRWSQLPLHAAIIFSAPKKVIAALINLYPLSIRCTDDQQMLPLHLAFRFGADDGIIIMLVRHFPDALFTRNVRGRVPTDIEGPRKDLAAIIQEVIKVTTENASAKQGKIFEAQITDMRDDLNLQTRLNASLEGEKLELEKKLSRTNTELILLQNQYRLLSASKDPVPSSVRSTEGRGRPLDPSPVKSRIRPGQQSTTSGSRDLSMTAKALSTGSVPAETRYDSDSTRRLQGGNTEDGIRSNLESPTARMELVTAKPQEMPSASSNYITKHPSLGSKEGSSTWRSQTNPRRKTHGFFQGFGGGVEE